MKKRIFAVIIAAILVVCTMLTVACGDSNNGGGSGGNGENGSGSGSKPKPQPPTKFEPNPDAFPTKEVYKEVGEDFVIMQISDIQIDSEHNNGDAANTWRQAAPHVTKMVDTIKPDMIVLAGDNIGGSRDHDLFIDMVELFDSFKIPWAPIYGNHERDLGDKDGLSGLKWMGKKFMESEYCLYSDGPDDFPPNRGRYPYVGNYTVSLMEGKNTMYSMIFMDSGDLYGSFCEEQVTWYEEQVKGATRRQYKEYNAEDGSVVPSMMFFHSPLEEFGQAAKDVLGSDGVGIVPEGIGSGENREEAKHEQSENVGMFAKALELNSTTNMFCGHKHKNCASIPYQGIVTTFGVKSSYNNAHDRDMVGCTLITVKDWSNEVEITPKRYNETFFGWK